MEEQTSISALPSGYKLHSKNRIYEIVRVLGTGSFGITYLATSKVLIGNISTTVKFAIKEHFMSSSCYRSDDGATVLTVPTAKNDVTLFRTDFIREANRLRNLCQKSRNIVSVNETFEANGTAYYVMEFLDGGNPSRCPEEDAVSIVMQIADALKVIHKEHVLHLDIKPGNIVLKTDLNNETYPVLIDFGISKHFDEKNRPTTSFTAKGVSPGYAPQEQYAGVSEFSPKYDIYALGALLFFLCTGKNPPDAFKISAGQDELKEKLDPNLSSAVTKTILNAMKPDAKDRTASIEQFCDDLTGSDFMPVLNIPYTRLDFSKDKGLRSIPVESNTSWTCFTEKETDWCKVSKEEDRMIVTVSKNKDTESRSCDIVINSPAYRITQVIHVNQEGTGTIMIPSGPSWWDKNRKKVYLSAGAVVIIGLCVTLFVLLKPSPDKGDGATEKPVTIVSSEQSAREEITDSNEQEATEAVDSDPIENPQNESNDEKFVRASKTKDFSLMLSLARANYPKAFYPTALGYYNSSNYPEAGKWARKAISANVNKSEAIALIDRINSSGSAQVEKVEKPVKAESDDALFAKATTISDFKALADRGYSKAYASLAQKYLAARNYSGANTYARRALAANVGRAQAINVIEKLDIIGYYDNGENGGKPKY